MALRRNTIIGNLADAITYVGTLQGDTGPILAVMKAIGSDDLDVVNFEVTPNMRRVTAMLRRGGMIAVRLVSVRRPHPNDRLSLQITVPANYRDYEVLYFGGLKPDGVAAVHKMRPQDVRSTARLIIPLE